MMGFLATAILILTLLSSAAAKELGKENLTAPQKNSTSTQQERKTADINSIIANIIHSKATEANAASVQSKPQETDKVVHWRKKRYSPLLPLVAETFKNRNLAAQLNSHNHKDLIRKIESMQSNKINRNSRGNSFYGMRGKKDDDEMYDDEEDAIESGKRGIGKNFVGMRGRKSEIPEHVNNYVDGYKRSGAFYGMRGKKSDEISLLKKNAKSSSFTAMRGKKADDSDNEYSATVLENETIPQVETQSASRWQQPYRSDGLDKMLHLHGGEYGSHRFYDKKGVGSIFVGMRGKK